MWVCLVDDSGGVCVVWVRSVCGGCVGVHVCGLGEECVRGCGRAYG